MAVSSCMFNSMYFDSCANEKLVEKMGTTQQMNTNFLYHSKVPTTYQEALVLESMTVEEKRNKSGTNAASKTVSIQAWDFQFIDKIPHNTDFYTWQERQKQEQWIQSVLDLEAVADLDT